jgi:hypothetical protein
MIMASSSGLKQSTFDLKKKKNTMRIYGEKKNVDELGIH